LNFRQGFLVLFSQGQVKKDLCFLESGLCLFPLGNDLTQFSPFFE
jgi:hypothetical protein